MRRRNKILIALVFVIGLPIIILSAGVSYLAFADLGRYRATVERLVSDALGRELRIAGTFEPVVSLTPVLEATGITLANSAWGSEPAMVTVDRFSASIDLLSLVHGSIRLRHVEIEGARVLLEVNEDGSTNWGFETVGTDRRDAATDRDFILEQADIRNAVLIYRAPTLDQPLELVIGRLDSSSDISGMIQLQLDGRLNEKGFDLQGRLGPQSGLLTAERVEFDLRGHLEQAGFTLSGRVTSLAELGGASIDFDSHGPNIAAVTSAFHLPSPGEGPFRLSAHVDPSSAGSELTLDVDLGDLTARAHGLLDSLVEPGSLDITVAASGPDLAAAGALAGLGRLPPEPFDVSGHLVWQGFPVTFENVSIRVGENSLWVDGLLGEPPRMMETDIVVRGEGPDVSALAGLAGLKLPAESYKVHGRLLRVENGIRSENVEARIGKTTLAASGFVGDSPTFFGTDLHAHILCPDLSRYNDLAGIDLPAETLEVSGRLGEGGEGMTLRDVSAHLGENSARIDGEIRLAGEHTELDLRLDVEGPDLSRLEPLVGIKGLPAAPYRSAGAIGVQPDGWHLEEVSVESESMVLAAEGIVITDPGFLGTELRLRLAGPDGSVPAALAGLHGVPPEPFTLEGAIRIVDGGYALDAVEAEVGSTAVAVDGRLGPAPLFPGTALVVNGRGADLSILQPLFGGKPLPGEPFSLAGGFRVDETGWQLDSVEIKIGPDRAAVSGLLVLAENLAGTTMDVEVECRDLCETGGILARAGVEGIPELPTASCSISGRVEIDDAGVLLHGVEGRLGSGTLRLDGRIGPPPEHRGTDITVHGDGPDASLFTMLAGDAVPVAPFELGGRIKRHDTGFTLHDVSVRLGKYRAVLDGTLGEPPTMEGTDLDIRAEGPGLELSRQIADRFGSHFPGDLPDGPFEVTGHCRGSPEDFTISGLDIRLGHSDLSGWFRLDLDEKPRLQGELTSAKIDLASWFKQREEAAISADGNDVEPAREKNNLLLPDDPIDMAWLNRIDADVQLSVRELLLPHTRLSDARVGVRLENGGLLVDPVSATGPRGGILGGLFSAEPAEEGCRMRADLTVNGGHLDLSNSAEDSGQWVALDIDTELLGAGRSLHDIAGNADGILVVAASDGSVDNSLFDFISSGIVLQILNILIPIRDEESSTKLNCGVIVMNLDEGMATLEPLALQTENISMTGRGKIDFATEEFSLQWVTKPRKGTGISASTITDNYVKLGGTLGEPHLVVKPLQAALSTGVAVGTAGLSLVGRGLWNRLTAHKKVCACALEEAADQREKRAPPTPENKRR